MQDIELTGVNETLAELKKYEQELYTRIRNELIIVAQPVVSNVRKGFSHAPLANWRSKGKRTKRSYKLVEGKVKRVGNFPPYDPAAASQGVRAKAGTDGRTSNKYHQILRIQQMNAGGAVLDSAGGKSGQDNRFVKNLDKHLAVKSVGGKYRSRVMFGRVRQSEPLIEKNVRKIVEKYSDVVTKKIAGF